jgi:hypothetical protein
VVPGYGRRLSDERHGSSSARRACGHHARPGPEKTMPLGPGTVGHERA